MRRGLALTRLQPRSEGLSRDEMDSRSWLLVDYAHFLARVDRRAEAVELLRKEIEQASATSESARKAAHLLAFDFGNDVSEDDEILWIWLASRPKWEYTEKRLLWRMLENAKRDDLDRYLLRAEELANGRDPSRSHTLGWIMNRMQFPKRSISLLEYAVETAHDEESREQAVFTLFESYLDTGDWRRAEDVFPEASRRLTPMEVPDWYSRVAVTAAVAGKKADAIRLWRAVANINPAELDRLDELAKLGLRHELVAFYDEMARKMPSSEIPTKVLRVLEEE